MCYPGGMARDEHPDCRTVTLGPGITAPYPTPTSTAATVVGKANRRRDTKPEVLLRSTLHARGLRFRKDFLIRLPELRVRADVVFTRHKIAIFVDGCFWHCCPEHGRVPKSNLGYWEPKLQANVDRDARVNAALTGAGWIVRRFWEHTDPEAAADLVDDIVRSC